MSSSDSAGPLNQAHQHGANADEYIAQGLLVRAAEEHRKAAEAFTACIDNSSDENHKRTLRMLKSKHDKSLKELERRIAKLREDGIDPTLPQPSKPSPAPRSSNGFSMHNPPVIANQNPKPAPRSSSPPQGRPWNRMSESQAVGEESFMVLGGRSQFDPGDAFNRFWKVMEGVEDKLSQPVAFTSVPLEFSDIKAGGASSGSSSDTDAEGPRKAKVQKGSLGRKDIKPGPTEPHAGLSQFPPPRMQSYTVDLKAELDEVLADDDDELAESFFLIPSAAPVKPVASIPTLTSLHTENTALKNELEAMKKRLSVQEHMLKARQDQDRELRDSIVVARREAQRAMASSMMLPGPPRAGPSSLPAPPPPPGMPDLVNLGANVPMPGALPTAKEEQLTKRVKDLEDELRHLKVENERQSTMIARFREKWEKLKENSKKKKQARAVAESEARTGGVRERIDEVPEEEERAAAADNMDKDHVEATAF